jgi:hypothetical protein
MNTVDEINKLIDWLDKNSKSTNLTDISMTLGKMSTQCYYFSKLVCDAYEIQNDMEDNYKEAKASFIKDSTDGITKATATVDADPIVRKAKKDWTDANNIYQRLKTYAHQFEQIMDCKRQFISVEKSLNVKGV